MRPGRYKPAASRARTSAGHLTDIAASSRWAAILAPIRGRAGKRGAIGGGCGEPWPRLEPTGRPGRARGRRRWPDRCMRWWCCCSRRSRCSTAWPATPAGPTWPCWPRSWSHPPWPPSRPAPSARSWPAADPGTPSVGCCSPSAGVGGRPRPGRRGPIGPRALRRRAQRVAQPGVAVAAAATRVGRRLSRVSGGGGSGAARRTARPPPPASAAGWRPAWTGRSRR